VAPLGLFSGAGTAAVSKSGFTGGKGAFGGSAAQGLGGTLGGDVSASIARGIERRMSAAANTVSGIGAMINHGQDIDRRLPAQAQSGRPETAKTGFGDANTGRAELAAFTSAVPGSTDFEVDSFEGELVGILRFDDKIPLFETRACCALGAPVTVTKRVDPQKARIGHSYFSDGGAGMCIPSPAA
jgi:hypothetical protein